MNFGTHVLAKRLGAGGLLQRHYLRFPFFILLGLVRRCGFTLSLFGSRLGPFMSFALMVFLRIPIHRLLLICHATIRTAVA